MAVADGFEEVLCFGRVPVDSRPVDQRRLSVLTVMVELIVREGFFGKDLISVVGLIDFEIDIELRIFG